MPSGFQPSRYNFTFDHDDGTHLVFNTLSGAFARIRPELYDLSNAMLEDPESFEPKNEEEQALFDAAVSSQFVIQSTTNEMKVLRLRINAMKYGTKHFHLTMIPTMNCNFACPYCYENPSPEKMSRENQELVAAWAREKVKGTTNMSVSWFGGEPLLAWEAMKYLTEQYQEACEEYKSKYSSSITTNGWFMKPDVADAFPDMGIQGVQITIDGPPKVHDQRRPLRGGGPTFQRILDNITYLCENQPDVRLQIRVNVDNTTAHCVPELLDLFPQSVKDHAVIYFRHIFGAPSFWDTDRPAKENQIKIDGIDERVDLRPSFRLAQKHGFRVFLTQYHPAGGYCEADYLNYYIVDLHCNLHKCTVGFDDAHRIGRVLEDGKDEVDIPLLAEWLSQDPMDRPDCRECKILPMCLGGCSFGNVCSEAKKGCNSVMTPAEMVDDLKFLYTNLCYEQERELSKAEPDRENVVT